MPDTFAHPSPRSGLREGHGLDNPGLDVVDIAAVAAIRGGATEWSAYRATSPGRVDLRLAALSGAVLSSLELRNCDLAGADLSDCNFDGCTLYDCDLRGATLDRTSFVSADLTDVDFTDAVANHSVFRHSALHRVTISRTTLTGARFLDCDLEGIVLEDIDDATGFMLHDCRVSGSRIQRVTLRDVSLNGLTGHNVALVESSIRGDVTNWHVSDSRMDAVTVHGSCSGLEILHSVIRGLRMTGAALTDSSFTSCRLEGLVLDQFDLSSTPLLGCSVVCCEWPPQAPLVSSTGRYRRAPHLLAQPVQDLAGLPPILRREIADAQYLDELHRRPRALLPKAGFRVWGATSAFGRSLTRLTLWAVAIVAALSCAMCLIDGVSGTLGEAPTSAWRALKVISQSFIGLTADEAARFSGSQATIIIVARVAGFFVLGLWIGIAANKFGKLSSE